MPAHFPTLSDGHTTRYPATHGVEVPSAVIRFENDSEQVWARSAPIHHWILAFNDISAADVTTLETFFLACKGAFDATWDITIDGVLYSYCTFLEDDFSPIETREGRYSLSFKIRQIRKN